MESLTNPAAIARRILEATLSGGATHLSEAPSFSEEGAIGGLVVQLRDAAGELRSSVGRTTVASLAEVLRDLAKEAVFGDPRFPPLGAEELASLQVEVWTLGPARPFREVGDLEPTRDAVRVNSGLFGSLLLPDVATERGWDARATVAYACHLAGLGADAIRRPETQVHLHEATCYRG